MRLDEARARKAALLGEVGGQVRAGALEPGAEVGGLYVGIVPSEDPDGYRLAIRLTGDETAEPTDRIEAARSSAGPDADIRFVGRVTALTIQPDEPELDEPEPPSGDNDEPTADELQQRTRPLVRGSSVAHIDVTAGTIGAFVRIGEGTAIHILSNNHVLAATDSGERGDPVLQPGPADGGQDEDRVGTLATAIPLDPARTNLVDAAVAEVDADISVDAGAHDGPITDVIGPDLVRGVRKIGRTTGVTRGQISAFEIDGVPVGYGTGVFTFDDQIEVEGVLGLFSAGGDSGSVITTEGDRLGVGLLFAGSTTGGPGGTGVTYANPLGTVLGALDASLYGGPGADDPAEESPTEEDPVAGW